MFNFEELVDRRGLYHRSVETRIFEGVEPKDGFSIIPMSIADMNFKTAPAVINEIDKRFKRDVFGYSINSKEFFDSIISWQKRRHGVNSIDEKNIGYENGVLGGLSSTATALLSRGDNILLHRPTYAGFNGILKNLGFNLIYSDLKIDKENVWRMDYEDMEKKIVENKIHLFVMCSPHNPTGRVWTRKELEKAYEIFKKHDIYVVSDEIWSDLILSGKKHIPSQLINEDAKSRTIAFYAPTKGYNLAGLGVSYHIVYNDFLNDRLLKEESLCHYNLNNVLSEAALIGAYSNDGEAWLDSLREVIEGNINLALDFFSKIKGVDVIKPEGTYLIYPDFEKYLINKNISLYDLLVKCIEHGLLVSDGRIFGGKSTIRMNLAMPRKMLEEALDRFDKYIL